jgi:hypothetical protein
VEIGDRVEAARLDEATRAMAELASRWDPGLDAIKRLAEAARAEAEQERHPHGNETK